MQRVSKYKKRAFLLVGGLLVATTLYLSFLSEAQLLQVANGDKYGHFLAYFVLMLWFGLSYPSILTSAILLSCMGIGIEFLQNLTATRAFESADVVASVLGVLFALVTLMAGLRKIAMLFRGKI